MLDMRDLLLEAQAEFAEIAQEIQKELVLPRMTEALRMQWMNTPEALKEMLRQQDPDTYRMIVELTNDQ